MDWFSNLSTPKKIGLGAAVALVATALCCCGLFLGRGHSDAVYPGTPTRPKGGSHRATPTKAKPPAMPAKKTLNRK